MHALRGALPLQAKEDAEILFFRVHGGVRAALRAPRNMNKVK